jgi:hypothetical protein
MPIKYDIIEEKQLVIAKGTGVITGPDVIAHLNALAADDRYSAPMKKLVDYRFIESIIISPDEAISIALKKDTLIGKFRGEKCAFISPGDETYNASRIHQSLIDSSGIGTAVFRELEKALDWLDVALNTPLD